MMAGILLTLVLVLVLVLVLLHCPPHRTATVGVVQVQPWWCCRSAG
jgi:hypothetical protein